ncbi:hypothetical protein R5W23_003382 [Gemmata sp. JC673]|uniref:Uncharacterized protein n=1 Tax=Gemmata algarum TaxID=2975278 RepID=A0ABU5F2Z1_9BACT|nr:hypothetical protein [Gemmata algarum]MDY3561952.1 hypothetical protein [Gemmata algarum]
MSGMKGDGSGAAEWRREAELRKQFARCFHDVGPAAALPLAEELAELLTEKGHLSSVVWCDIWEARGRLDKAVEIGRDNIDGCVAELADRAARVSDASALREDVEDLLDSYYFQAKRYLAMGVPGAARATMAEAHDLASQYHVPFDETLQGLFNELGEGQL